MNRFLFGMMGLLMLAAPSRTADPKVPPASASGTLTADDKKYSLASALAYNTKVGGKTRTVVYLTEKPLDMTRLGKSFKKHGTDQDFFVFDPHVQLIFDEKGTLHQSVIYAEGKTINQIGGDEIKASAELTGGKAIGKGNTSKPLKSFGGTMTFELKFDVKMTLP